MRAVVLIGVGQTGGLLPLMAVHSGIKKMAEWAYSQGIPQERVAILSDKDNKPVTAEMVLQRITEFCDGTIEQLIVYFAGHGTVRGSDEVWLLSGAPDVRHEAVDLSATIESARFCNVDTVVFISDACRTPATRLRAQWVTGIPVFPNQQRDEEHPVDVFYATGVGHSSFEVEVGAVTPDETEPDYQAVYTEALVSALKGEQPEAMHADAIAGFGLIRTRPYLNTFLRKDVARRLKLATGDSLLLQKPVARVLSDDEVLSRFPLAPGFVPGPVGPSGGPVSGAVDPLHQLHEAMRRLLGLDASPVGAGIEGPPDLVVIASSRAVRDAAPSSRLIVTGGSVASASARGGSLAVDESGISVDGAAEGVTDLLVHTSDGSAFVMPAVPSATAVVAFSAGELRDLVYVPDDGQPLPNTVRGLRGTVAARARLGDLWLEDDEAAAAARTAAAAGDIALSLHVAYALSDLRRYGEDLRRIDEAVRSRWGFRLFDLALLTGDLDGRFVDDVDVHPSTPLLSRGWAIARWRTVRLPAAFDGIESHLLPSVWTQFDIEGAAVISAQGFDGPTEETE